MPEDGYDAAAAEAVEALTDLLLWRLPPERWTAAAELVEAFGAADSVDALRAATFALDMASPPRIVKVGASTPPVPPPPPVRERVNVLVHRLSRPPA